jgi:hypothetical protein
MRADECEERRRQDKKQGEEARARRGSESKERKREEARGSDAPRSSALNARTA